MKIRRALISVNNKEGLLDLGKILMRNDVEIVSTGGTYNFLKRGGVRARSIEEYTGYREILGGRVKTLNRVIHGGILAMREDEEHKRDMEREKVGYIDLIVVNLYSFEEKVDLSKSHEEMIENIDIGGVSLLRSGAKNYKYTVVISEIEDYGDLIEDMKRGRFPGIEKREYWAWKAFKKTSEYDQKISEYFKKKFKGELS